MLGKLTASLFSLDRLGTGKAWKPRTGKRVYIFFTPTPCLLITTGALFARCSRRNNRNKNMNDLIYVGVIAAFFALSALYVRWCARQ